MPPSDKNKSTGNSSSEEGQTQLCSGSCRMDFQRELTSPSTSNVTLSGHGSIVNIPWVTASQSTIKCSVNDQMKTFDPGEGAGIERLTSSSSGNSVILGKSCSSLIKNSNKNYKAGSKINKLADMLAKRSQNVVEVKENTSDTNVDINSASKLKSEPVILKSVSDDIKSVNESSSKNTTSNNEVKLFRKSRRKSVPNQSYSLQHWQSQSTSKSCSDIFELFPLEEEEKKTELNALGNSMSNFQTDESTNKKTDRMNSKNSELSLVMSEKKRSTQRSDTVNSSKAIRNNLGKLIENTAVKLMNKVAEKPFAKASDTPLEKPIRKTIEKIIEKSLQKSTEKLMEKSVEKFPEKAIEKSEKTTEVQDKPAVKVQEKPIAKFQQIPTVKSVEISTEKPTVKPEKLIEKSPTKILEKSVEKPAEKVQEKHTAIDLGKSIEKLTEKIEDKPTVKVAEKCIDKPIAKAIEKLTEKPAVKVIAKLIEKPTVKTGEKSIEKSATEAIENSVEKPTLEAVEKSIEKPTIKVMDKYTKNPAEKVQDKPVVKFQGTPTGKIVEKSIEKLTVKAIEKLVEKPAETVQNKPTVKFQEKPTIKALEKLDEKPPLRAVEKYTEKPTRKTVEKSIEKLTGKAIEKPVEKPAETVQNKPMVKFAEKFTVKEKLDEKPTVKAIEKLAEKPALKAVEKSVEKPTVKAVEKLAEKPSEKLQDKPTMKLQEKPTIKTLEKLMEIPAVKTTEKSTEKPTVKAVEKSIEKPIVKAVEKSTVKAVEKSIEKPTVRAQDKSIDKPTVKTVEKSFDKLAVRAVEKSVEKPTVKTVQKSIEEPTVKSVEISVEKPKVKTGEKSFEKPTIKAVEKSVEKPTVKSMEKSIEEPKIKAVEKLTENPMVKAVEKSMEKPAVKTVEKVIAGEKSVEKPTVKSVEKSIEVPKIKAVEKFAEKPTVKAVEKSSEKSTVKAVEKVAEKSTVKAIEKVAEKSTVKAIEKVAEKSTVKAIEKVAEKSTVKAIEKVAEKQALKAVGKSIEKPVGKVQDKFTVKASAIVESFSDKSEKKITEKHKKEPIVAEGEKLVENSKEQLLKVPLKNSVEKLAENFDKRQAEKPKKAVVDSLIEKSHKEKTNLKILEKPKENSEKSVETPIEKLKANSSEKLNDSSERNYNENLSEKCTEKSKKRVNENSAKVHNDKPVKKPKEKSSDCLEKNSSTNSSEVYIEELKEKPTDRHKQVPLEKRKSTTFENLVEKPEEKVGKTLSGEVTKKPEEKNFEKLFGNSEKPKEKSVEKSKEKQIEKEKETRSFTETPREKCKEKIIGKPKEIVEKSREVSREKPKEKIVEKLRRNSIEKPKEKHRESSVEKPKKVVEKLTDTSVKKHKGKDEGKTQENFKEKDRFVEKTKEKCLEKSMSRSKDKATKKLIEKALEKSSRKHGGKSKRRMRERANDDHSVSRHETTRIRTTRERSCKNLNLTSSVRSSKHRDMYSKKKENKSKQRKSKRLVESSTQTADIEFISVIKPSDVENESPPRADVVGLENVKLKKSTAVETEKPNSENERPKILTYECLYCTQTFTVWALCKSHEKTHAPRKYKQFRCQYCSKKLFSLEEFKNHCIQKHRNKYAYCKKCDFRFSAKVELYAHNKEVHLKRSAESPRTVLEERPKTSVQEIVLVQEIVENEKTDLKVPEERTESDVLEINFPEIKEVQTVFPENGDYIVLEKGLMQTVPEITNFEITFEMVQIELEQVPQEVASQKISGENEIENVTEEKLSNDIVEDKAVEKVSEIKVTQNIPLEIAVEEVFEEIAMEKSFEENTVTMVCEEITINEIPEMSVTNNITSDKTLEWVFEEVAIENVFEETTTKMVCEEKAENKVPEVKVTETVPSEKEVERIFEEVEMEKSSEENAMAVMVYVENSENKVPEVNVTKNVPSEKATKKVSERKTVEEVSENKAVKMVPEENAVHKVPEIKVTETVPSEKAENKITEENVVEKISAEKAVKMVPEENAVHKVPEIKVTETVPSEKAENKITEENVVEKISAEKAVKMVSEEETVNPVPEIKVPKNIPSEKAPKMASEDNAVHKAPEVKVPKNISSEKALKRITEEKAGERVSEVKVSKNIPSEKGVEKVSEKKAVKIVPKENAVHKVPEVKVNKNIPSEKAVKKTSEEKVVEKVSEKKALKVTPEENAVHKVPEGKVTKNIPSEKAGNEISEEKAARKVFEEKEMEKISEDKAQNIVSQGSGAHKIPEVKVPKNIPSEKAVKRVSEEKAVEKVSEKKAVKIIFEEEKAMEKVSEKKAVKIISEESPDHKVPEVKVTKSIPSEKAVSRTSEEEVVEKVSEKKAVKMVSEDIAVHKVPEVKATKNIPSEKPVKRVSEEKSVEKVSEKKAAKVVPEENAAYKVPEVKVTKNIPAEKSMKIVPEENAVRRIPEIKVTKNIPSEKAVKRVSEEKAVEKVSEKKAVKMVSEDIAVHKVPEVKATKNIPSEKAVSRTSEEKVVEKVSEKKAVKIVPEENAVHKVPEIKVTKNTPPEKPVKRVSEEKSAEKVSEKKAAKAVPEENAVHKVPEVKAIKNIPLEKAGRKISEEKVVEKVSEKKAVKIVPEENPVHKVSEGKITKNIPEKAGNKVSEEKTARKVFDKKTVEKVSEEKSVKTIAEEKAVNKVPEVKKAKYISSEKSVKKVSEEVTVKKVSEGKAVKRVSEGKAVKMVLEEKAEKKLSEEKADRKIAKTGPKDLRIDVTFDTTKKSSVSPRSSQRFSPKEKTEEQILEMEMLFYSHLSGNIQENLTHHLDGKIDQNGVPVRRNHVVDVSESSKSNSLLSVAVPTAGAPDTQILRAPSPYQTRSKTPNPLPPTAKKFKKLPNWQQKFWEKYNFPTNYRYQHRFWDKNYLNTEKSAFYLKDLSCLDIKTQLTMRDNIKKLDEIKKTEESSKPADELKFPAYLSLIPRVNEASPSEKKVDLQKNNLECVKTKKQVGREDTKKSFKSPGSELPVAKSRSVGRSKTSSDSSSESKNQSEGLKMMTRRQSSLESTKDDKEDSCKRRKGSLDLSGVQRMALRRQTSLDNVGGNVPKSEKSDHASDPLLRNSDLDNSPLSPTGSTEISGEWVRPRSYLCGTCCTKFTNLWELEDHKWVSHPNVWCTHYEFEDEKIDKLFQKNEGDGGEKSGESSEMSKSKLTDLYKRYLLPHGYLKTAKLVPKTNFPEECTKCKKNCMNSSEMHKHMLDCGGDTTWFLTMYSSPMTIKRKWRPFGSRRKKQIGRRDVKRNIPNTPNLRSYHYQHRIRTKPGDVETIQKMLANLPEKRARRAINFDDIKTRSQATIHSNRLLRKRFKSSFSNNFLKLKTMKQKRQLKQGKKEAGSKSTTDTSSENTPVGSPKRRNKLKESLQLLKEENSRDGSSENSEDLMKTQKKKVLKKKESPDSPQRKNQVLGIEKSKVKKEIAEASQDKPITRSNGFVLSQESKTKKKTCVVKEEILDEVECSSGSAIEAKRSKLVSKSGKKTKKSSGQGVETAAEKKAAMMYNVNITSSSDDVIDKEPPVKVAKKMKAEAEDTQEYKPCDKSNPHWISARCNPILRLKQSSIVKSELLKSMKKKVKNSRKILEKKEAEKAEGGSRRSLRLRSLQHVENEPEPLNKEVSESSKRTESVVMEKDLKIKTVVVSLENTISIKGLNRIPKTTCIKAEKETSEEISPVVRRSLRNSVSSEEKQEIQKSNISNVISLNPRSVLRRNLRNEKNDYPAPDAVEVSPKTAATLQKHPNGRSVADSKLTAQVSLLKKSNIQNLKGVRVVSKHEEHSEVRKPETKKSVDLEEMPILAKVEPIRGKTFSKTEKEIPVLLPVEREQKRGFNVEEQVEKDSVSFQVIKKRRKNSKEITPLKIIKTVDTVNLERGNGFGSSFRVESNESLDEAPDSRKSKKKRVYDVPTSRAAEKKVKTDIKKYFLGIDPNEIDKGRCDGQDESGSDNEPLITLVNHQDQVQNEFIARSEDGEEENPDSQLFLAPRLSAESATSKSNTSHELPVLSPQDEGKSRSANSTQIVRLKVSGESFKLKKKIKKKEHFFPNSTKELRVTVTLKEPTLKITENSITPRERKWSTETSESKKSETIADAEETSPDAKESVLPERRSRRISKETKSTSEFVIDDPLILVDELWSDLDSDSDSSRRKSKKGKKKSPKKKTAEEKRTSDVNLEELLRNFGENKESKRTERLSVIKVARKRKSASFVLESRRKKAENRKEKQSYRRLSLKLFRFNKSYKNFGNRGVKLSEAKRALREKLDELNARSSNALPDLPFLAAEIKENPVQVIQCGTQKPRTAKKSSKKVDFKSQNSDIHLKISLPLEAISNIPVFNNNHLTEPILEEQRESSSVREKTPDSGKAEKETISLTEAPLVEDEIAVSNDDANDIKNKSKRSDVIDKIFYCEICKTYYYSSSQLKIHKLSNRHRLKESELQESREPLLQPDSYETVKIESLEIQSSCSEPVPIVENILQEPSKIENSEEERLNDDTSEMPTLEGPFIEGPVTRLPAEPIQTPSPPPPVASFGFTQESLKDIQKAIGCTDEEMLILTLLGENTIEIENDILDLDSCKPAPSRPPQGTREKEESGVKDNEKANGVFKVDLKQRMTSALACLVNKAVFNLLQKYENAAKTTVNPEALSLLGKLSNLSRRKNVLQLNELLKKKGDGESSVNAFPKEAEKKEPPVSYKYQCTICGNRFEKASTRECHISRSHRGKAKKLAEDLQSLHTEDEWNDSWNYDVGDDHLESTTAPQFWCSDCGINFVSPQEVLDHQKVEHQAGLKDPDRNRDSSPLQSSTIGSSDEILEGKKSRRRPKLFSSEELHQQRIIANNELRKLDRRFSNKNKNNKTKWGMDALKFTVEKENKAIADEEDKEVVSEESLKPPVDVKNIDLVPKLNLSRISNIPEFKVIQKNSFENRFQKIIDNKLKRKFACPSQDENVGDDVEEEVMLVPVVVKKKNKRQKLGKCSSKKDAGKPLDVYDFNESESEGEPAVYSHVKKPVPSPMKIKLVKEKERPSKNKADSTTKDLAPDDYDSEDSLPLSVVKKSKPGDEDDDKDEKASEDGVEKSDGILEQVEYLIEQLENETGSLKNENVTQEGDFEQESDSKEETEKSEFSKESSDDSVFSTDKSVRVSVANKFLEMDEILLKNQKCDESKGKKSEEHLEDDRVEEVREQERESVLAEPESSQSTFDEEDSIPLVLISKKADKSKFESEVKKCDENTTDVSTTASEDVSLSKAEEHKSSDSRDSTMIGQTATEESLPPVFSSSENDGASSEKSDKAFETLNGNVIYCRNDSMTDFESDLSNDGLIDSNYEKNNSVNSGGNYIKEITEKEDVVIVCSKGDEEESNESKMSRELESTLEKDAEHSEEQKKKKRFPLLTATIEENNFRRSESPKSNKEVIVRKIWSRKKLTEDSTDNDEDSYISLDNCTSIENLQEDESRTEVDKEIIVKKIWSRKKLEEEFTEKIEGNFDDIKINQTEVSDEVVIKCGPKAKPSSKRRRSKSSNEASKDTIMRKIWSGKCTFQTKAALKTYESDMLANCKENEEAEGRSKSKRRRRPSSFSTMKRSKVDSDKDDEDDDLDSLLEEIEREQLEKAIRSEFLQLRRSEKANVEMKDGAPTVGIFTETTLDPKKEVSEKKRRKIKKKLKHPKQSLLKRKKIIRKPFRRVLPSEERNIRESVNHMCIEEHTENSLDKTAEMFRGEGKTKNRKHKKHRHKHHHHKHKHKKSKHHKSAMSKHKSKHEFGEKEEVVEKADSFTILEKICQEIPSQIESESKRSSSRKGSSSESNDENSKAADVFSLSGETNESPEAEFDNGDSGLPGKRHFESVNIYEFVEEVSDFSSDRLKNPKK